MQLLGVSLYNYGKGFIFEALIGKEKCILFIFHHMYCTILNGLAGGVTWDRVDKFWDPASGCVT